MAERITFSNGKLSVPDHPVIPYIAGDGIGPDITRATKLVIDAAVAKAYGGKRALGWQEMVAGEVALAQGKDLLGDDVLKTITDCRVALKGPMTTPVGGGFRSVNVTLRQKLDLYACVRPVRWFTGVPSPLKHPEKVNVVIYRENTEDVYAGIEWQAGSPEAAKVRAALKEAVGTVLREDAGIGIKPISEMGSKRLVRAAINHALQQKLPSVTIVHKGNIMKFTEGAFRDWGYAVAREEFGATLIDKGPWCRISRDGHEVVVKDIIADSMFQQLLLRPDEYSVLATPNLNGDYLSDAAAAQVGGLGMAPGANIGDGIGVFEATHGSAPKYAGQDKVNPGSLILSAVMMLDFIGWQEASRLVVAGLEKTIADRIVTYDLARQTEGATEVSCSGFARAFVESL